MLQFDHAWRFTSPGAVPPDAVAAFWALLGKVLHQARDQATIEHFKRFFAPAAGETFSTSSSRSWAMSDLNSHFYAAADNAALFLEALSDSFDDLRKTNPSVALPDLDYVNALLAEHRVGFQLRPPQLIVDQNFSPIAVPLVTATLEKQARTVIQESLDESERLLNSGKNRPAVQEVLWLLETVMTAFKGLELDSATIQGKYFNVIAKELRTRAPGTVLEQTLSWATTLHGYLSSPTGGGLRHGADLKDGIELTKSAATLYCNLIRSYISFLLDEHERISSQR